MDTSLVINIFTSDEYSVFSFLELSISALDLLSHVGIAGVLVINTLAQVVVFSTGALVVGT